MSRLLKKPGNGWKIAVPEWTDKKLRIVKKINPGLFLRRKYEFS